MMYENALHFLHILAWVCWLGTDFGVFMAAKFSENSELGVEARMTMLKLLSKLDKIPRLAVPVVFTTGILLAANYGVDFIPVEIGGAIGVIWIITTLVGVTGDQHSAVATTALKLVRYTFLGAGLILGGSAIWSLTGADLMPRWMAVKWLAFAWTALFSFAIEIRLKPAITDYIRLQTEGATQEINASLSKNLGRVYQVVIMVYLGTIVAAYFGINKVF